MGITTDIRQAALTAAIGLAAAAFSVPASAATVTMKIGTATTSGDQNHWMERFKQRMEKRAPGRVNVKLFPASQLGSITREIESLQLGTQEAWVGPPVFATGVDPRFQVVAAPGLIKDWVHGQRALSDPEFRDYFLGIGEAKGIKGIGLYASNLAAVVSRKGAIRKVEDFRGLKFRVLGSAIEIEMMKRLGAAGVPMDLSATLPALQRGVIDGVRSSLTVFVPFKYWTVTKDLTRTNGAMIVTAILVSKRWWDGLPHDLQQIMLDEAKKQDQENFKYALDQDKRFRAIWKKNGGNIIEFSSAEHDKLMKVIRPAGEAVVAGNPALKEAYHRLVVAVAKNAN